MTCIYPAYITFISIIITSASAGIAYQALKSGKNFNGKIMNLIGNLIWLVFGGFWAALGYIVGGFVLCLTFVGIPWGLQCFKLAGVVLWPFGKQIVPKTGGTGCLSLLCNIIWLLCGGLYTAFIHLVFAFILFITIIGIPFARQHIKLMELSLLPFSRDVIS